MSCSGLHPGRVLDFGPERTITIVVCFWVSAWPQGDLTLGYGNLIWNGNTAMMITAGSYEDITGGCVAFFERYRLTGYAAASTAGPGRAWVVGVDGYTACHFVSAAQNWFGGDLGFAICRQRL